MRAPKRNTRVRQAEIAQAALDVIADRGVAGLSVAAVAQRVGIVPSGIYRHYPDREALIDAAFDGIGVHLDAQIEAVARLDADAITRLHRLFTLHLDALRANAVIHRVVFSRDGVAGHPGRRLRLLATIQRYLARVAAIAAAGQREGSLRGDVDPAAVARAFLGLIQPAAFLWHLSAGSPDVLQQTEAAWPLFVRAIAAPDGARAVAAGAQP